MREGGLQIFNSTTQRGLCVKLQFRISAARCPCQQGGNISNGKVARADDETAEFVRAQCACQRAQRIAQWRGFGEVMALQQRASVDE